LIFDRAGNAIYSDGGRRVCQLEPQAAYPTSGTYYSAALDSKTYQCQWHRVVLSACVPPGTAVHVDTFTAESAKPIDEITQLPEDRWGTGQTDSNTQNKHWDCLVQSPPGRYLWLRLTLTGDGADTPAIEKAKVFYPRASSLQYLPAVYRADPVSGDFLDRFLSIFDTLRGRTSDQIGGISAYFDPKATPANLPNTPGTDFLSWLASWMGMSLQNNWPVARRRELLRQAHRLYALRGTLAGLRLHIQLYTGVEPRILELFRLRRWMFVNYSRLGDCSNVFADRIMNRLQLGPNSRIGSFQLIDYGDPTMDLFNAYAHQFKVIVPRWPGAQESDRQSLQQIIDLAKPAHTIGELVWAEPRLRIGLQAFVGIDTVIGKYPAGVIEGQGKLGYDTVLGRPGENRTGPSGRVGDNSTIGCSTILN
jgi:phage tail-like protein